MNVTSKSCANRHKAKGCWVKCRKTVLLLFITKAWQCQQAHWWSWWREGSMVPDGFLVRPVPVNSHVSLYGFWGPLQMHVFAGLLYMSQRCHSTCKVSSLTEEYGLLPGDSLVAAGMVGYAGPFAGEYRAHFEKLWLATEDGETFCHKN